MSFMDKAKEKFEEIKDRFDAPDKPGVGEEEPSDAGAGLPADQEPAIGADPDLDPSTKDQYETE